MLLLNMHTCILSLYYYYYLFCGCGWDESAVNILTVTFFLNDLQIRDVSCLRLQFLFCSVY